MCPKKNTEAKGKDPKADETPAGAKGEKTEGTEATGGAPETTPDNPEGSRLTMDPPDDGGNAEQARKGFIQDTIAEILTLPEKAKDLDSSALLVGINELRSRRLDGSFGEPQAEVREATTLAVSQLRELYETAKAAEDAEAQKTGDGFRPECYEKINKGITKDTKMIVTKLRYRLGDGTNLTRGDEFVAGDMDARIILGAMSSFHIVPVEHKPLEGEARSVFVTRMMAIYDPNAAVKTCDK